MILADSSQNNPKQTFEVSFRIIWLSALFISVLASIPRILQPQINLVELVVDPFLAFIFSLLVWYYNIYRLPIYSSRRMKDRFFNRKTVYSLLIGIIMMAILVGIYQLLYPSYNAKSMMLMYQFKGLLINLTIGMFLYLLYQSHRTQLIGIELERVKADKMGAQFELLKQQVNPHFLFNSLNTLKAMIETGDEHAADFIIRLSDFYRFTLENKKSVLIPLREEL